MIDSSDILRIALADWGVPAQIAGEDLTVLFDPAPSQADPFAREQGHDGPSATLLRTDLERVAMWPLAVDILTHADIDYRILRADENSGAITLYLREGK
jgi:hypothetical protein